MCPEHTHDANPGSLHLMSDGLQRRPGQSAYQKSMCCGTGQPALDVQRPSTLTRAVGIPKVDVLQNREACTRCSKAFNVNLLETHNADALYGLVLRIDY